MMYYLIGIFSAMRIRSHFLSRRQPLPILPPSFHNVEEYIRLYLGFALQEVQAQAIKSLNPYYSII